MHSRGLLLCGLVNNHLRYKSSSSITKQLSTMTEIVLPKMEPWQLDVLKAKIENPKDRWFVIKSLRQCGKSVLAQVLLIYSSFEQSGSVSMCISPVVAQAKKMFEDVSRIAEQLIDKSNGSSLEITFTNKSKVLFKSAEQKDSLRGYTVKGSGILIVDEAAYISDDTFYRILVPTTNVNRSDIFIFSTPKFKNGFFYSLYCNGYGDNERIKSFDWTKYDLSKYLPPEILNVYKSQMPKSAFASEYLGEFIDADGTVFSDFKSCIGKYKVDYSLPVYVTVDWGTGQGMDNTVITVSQLAGNHIFVSESIAFNDKNANETIDYIVLLCRACANRGAKEINILVEKNSIGNVFYQILVEKLDTLQEQYNENASSKDEVQINAAAFLTTNASKERIIKQLIACFENHLITIPDDEKLILELSAYECKPNKNGTPTYNAPTGMKDDRVMSLCFAMQMLYNEVV